MLSIMLQILAVFFGWQIVRALPMKFQRLEVAAASVVLGTNLAAWLVFLLALVFGWGVGLPLAVVVMLAASVWAHLKFKPKYELIERRLRRAWFEWLPLLGAALLAVMLGNLVLQSYNFPDTGAWFSNSNVWGDSPLHVALANQFAHGDVVDMVSPLYLKVPLSYPMLSDFWSGTLLRLGGSWFWAMTVPTLLVMLSVAQLMFSFGYRLLGSLRAAWLQLGMIVFSGSLSGALLLGSVLLTQGWAAYDTKVGTSLTFATGDSYLNFFHSHLLPQRAYLFGIGMFILVASVLLHIYRETRLHHLNREATLRLGLIGGLVAGALPLVHTHSFLVLAGVMILGTSALALYGRGHVPPPWLLLVVTATALAVPQLFWQFSTTYSSGFGRWIAGWTMKGFELDPAGNWFSFWLSSIGLLFVAILTGWYFLRRYRASAEVWFAYWSGVAIFVICNVYVFQPTVWDNMKLFEYGFWFVMLAMSYVLAKWWAEKWGPAVVSTVMIAMCAMGFFTLVLSAPQLNFELLSAQDVTVGQYIQQNLPSDAYILVGDRHNSPVTMLGDRKVLMSYAGWYANYRSDWPQTMSDRTSMLTGAPNAADLIRQYGVGYAIFSADEVQSGEANLDYFRQNYLLEYDLNGWYIFNLQRAAGSVIK